MKIAISVVFALGILLTTESVRGDEFCFYEVDYGVDYSADCTPGFCCGTCRHRFCCFDNSLYLNQTEQCSTCYSYQDEFGSIQPAQECNANGEFCCGSCTNRTCCDTNEYMLNQTYCSNSAQSSTSLMNSTTPFAYTSTTTNAYWPYWFPSYYIQENSMYWLKVCIIGLPILLISMAVLTILIAYKRTRMLQANARIQVPLQPKTPATQAARISKTSANDNDDISLAPNYESLTRLSQPDANSNAFILPAEELPKYNNLKY